MRKINKFSISDPPTSNNPSSSGLYLPLHPLGGPPGGPFDQAVSDWRLSLSVREGNYFCLTGTGPSPGLVRRQVPRARLPIRE